MKIARKQTVVGIKMMFFVMGLFGVLLLGSLIAKVNLSLRKASAYAVVSFPVDHGEHPTFGAEWWYLNLLTRTSYGENDRDLAYVVSFSRIAGQKNLLSSRYESQSNSFRQSTEQNGSMVAQLLRDGRLWVQFNKGVTSVTLQELPMGNDRKSEYRLSGETENIGSFDLLLKERTVVAGGYNTPLLWGGTTGNCQGRISVLRIVRRPLLASPAPPLSIW